MDKKEAQEEIVKKINSLRKLINHELLVIENLADEHGIIVPLTGFPPFDSFGNSGYYFPVQSDGNPWYSSDIKEEYYPLEYTKGAPTGWLSSDAGC